jgi:hypothetical protein
MSQESKKVISDSVCRHSPQLNIQANFPIVKTWCAMKQIRCSAHTLAKGKSKKNFDLPFLREDESLLKD